MLKRAISMILVLIMLVSFLPVPSRAVEANTDGTQVDFEATNDFGALLTNSLDGSDQAQTASDANRICDVQIEGDYAWVEFVATEKARVVVAIYTEDGTQMLGSGTETVSPEETEVGIQIEIDAMPQYYSAGAYLLSAADNTPLSQEFRTQLYTKVVQDIKNSTVDDYDPERVLNLDDDRTTNFAVFGENTILLDSSVVVSVNGDVYTIENASDELKAMEPGDSFAQMQGGEMLIVKAAKVKVSGDTVTITDDPNADLSDVFEVVKIEGSSNADNTTWDDSTLDPDWEVISDEEFEELIGDEAQSRATGVNESTSLTKKFKTNGSILTAALSVSCTYSVEAYISFNYQYISWKFETKITGKLSLTAEFEPKEIPFIKCDFYLAAGCYMHTSLNLVIEASVALNYSVSWKASIGRTYDSNYGEWEDTGSKSSTNSKSEFEGKLSFGCSIKISIAFLSEKLTNITATAKVVREITGKRRIGAEAKASKNIHNCFSCIEGKQERVFSFSLSFSLFGKKAASLPKVSHSWLEGEFYYCMDDDEYGEGKCPHILYKVTVVAKDTEDIVCPLVSLSLSQNGDPVESITLLDDDGNAYSHWELNETDFDGNSVFYVPNGTYHLEGQKGRVRVSRDFTVRDNATKCKLEFDFSEKPTLLISESTASVALGTCQKLTANFGTDESNQDVTNACVWQSSDESVARIENGTIIPVSQGEATVTANYTKDGSDYQVACKVQILEKYGLFLSQESVSIAIGDPPVAVNAKLGFGLETDKDMTAECQWTSSDTNIVTVESGTISGVALGTATVTAIYTSNGRTYMVQCEVTVKPRPVVASGTCGENLTWKLDDLGTLTISGTGKMTDYSSEAGTGALLGTDYLYCVSIGSISSVVVEEGVTSIGERAFCGWRGLTSITLPQSLTSIGASAFTDCKGLTGISLPDGVTTIGDSAFKFCSNLTSITLPKSLISISRRVFYGCSGLTDVAIPDGITRIDIAAFQGCSGLTSVTLPESIVSIGIDAFSSCSNLTSINIPNNVTNIGDSAFMYCRNLTSITLPVSLTSIAKGMFVGCSSLTSIRIPDSVTSIGDYAFQDCTALASITLPDSVTSIGFATFIRCSDLSSITITDSVTNIGNYAFSDCCSLNSITIPEGVTIVGNSLFSGCSSLTSIDIPSSVNRINDHAFASCSSLTSITLPHNITYIGDYVFSSCSNLTSITLPKSITTIGEAVFYWCSSLTSVTIPESVTSIGVGAFYGCSNLTGVIIPNSVTSIGADAFSNCNSLMSVTIPESVTSIDSGAFALCSSLTSITIPDGIDCIAAEMFQNCVNLTSITIPDSVTSIGEWAFYNCTSLTDVYYSGTAEQWAQITIDSNNDCLTSATIHYNSGTASQAMVEDLPVVAAEPAQTEETVTEPVPVETEAATEPVPTETVTEEVTEEVSEEATEEPTEEATEEVTEETAESTVDVEPVSDRSWHLLPGGAEMSAGVAVKLAAFTGKESAKNGLRTVSFTGLEPGEDYALVVSLVAGSVEPGDLQYITQSTASDTGTLTISYIPRTAVNAIVQLYGIPTDRGITLDREYITMKAGAAAETLTATVSPARWADTLTWASSDETVLTVGADGSLTPVAPGTAYAIATVTHGKYTLSARCRVDVTEEMSNVAVTAVELGTSSVTTQLYSRSYVNFDILLLLEQNLPQVAAFSLEEESRDNGVAITGAKFADETARSLFALEVKDDRTLAVIPTQTAIDGGKTVKSSYKSQVIVSVNGVEFRTSDFLTLKVKKSTPKLTAKALSFNSFYTGQTQAISVTGGTVTGITGTMPDWLTLDSGKLTLTGTKTKASATLTLSVDTEEWAIPATVKCKVSLSYKAPALKLNKTSLTFAQTRSKGINLTLKAGKQTPADLGVKDIVPSEGFAVEDLNLEAGTFTLRPTGDTVPTGKQTITVSFYGTTSTLPLTLKTATKVPTLKLSKSSVSVNAVTGDCATLKVTANPGDFDLTRVTVTDPNGIFAVSDMDAQGYFTVATTDKTLPGKSYTLEVSTPGSKTVKLKVTTLSTKAVPSMTASAKGSIDLTYPERGLSILPKIKNYSGNLVSSSYTLSVKTGKTWVEKEFFEYFQVGTNGMLYQTADFSLAAGTLCRITLSGTLPDGTELSASTQVKVTQTAIPLKLSKSTVTLNKALGEWVTVAVSTRVKGYQLGIPVYELRDSKGNPSNALHLAWENGKLRIAVTEDTAFGTTYKVRIWETSNKISTLTVKILAQNKSGVTVTAKARGSIDVIRDSTAILITPTYKNWAGETPLDKQVKITQAPDKKNYTRDVSQYFTWQWLENGQLKLQKQPDASLEPGGKYRLELTAGGSKVATVALTVKSGTAKVSCRAVTLYKKDSNSQAILVFTLPDTTLNPLEWVAIKGAKQQSQFEILPWGENQFAIALFPDAPAKTAKLTLQLFFRGNPTNTANASVPLTVTIR